MNADKAGFIGSRTKAKLTLAQQANRLRHGAADLFTLPFGPPRSTILRR